MTESGNRALRAALLLVAATASPAPAQDAAAFDAAMAQAKRLMQRGSWAEAKRLILAQLDEHREQDYVRAQRAAVLEDLRRCSFHARHPAPDPAALISGELVEWDPRRGKLRLRYAGARPWADFEAAGDFLGHLLRLTDSYTLTLSGRSYPRRRPAGAGRAGRREHRLRRLVRHARAQQRHEDRVAAAVDPRPAAGAARRARGEEADAGGFRQAVPAARPRHAAADRALRPRAAAAEGDTRASAARLLRDRHQRGDRGAADRRRRRAIVAAGARRQRAAGEARERDYRPEGEVPAWLLATPELSRAERHALAKRERRIYPCPVPNEAWPWLDAGMQLHNDGKLAELKRYVEEGGEKDAPEAARRYLLAAACTGLEHWEEALVHATFVREAHPDFAEAHVLAAGSLFALRRDDEAMAAVEAATARGPQPDGVYVSCGALLLDHGRLDDAKRVLARAPAGGESRADSGLDQLRTMLLMAKKGPRFANAFEHTSKHYVVVSDIDEQLCIEASRVLEEAFVAFQADLDWVKEEAPRKFRVFLFAGEAGYQAYVEDIAGAAAPHTGGLYSSRLKQLLIWNLPDRAMMMRTVRHEGFHQYLDRLIVDAPRWFNEGLAEYYETGRRERGRLRGGQPRPDHAARLRERERDMRPLDAFLFLDPQAFYADAELHYAQAWAFVHFLREASHANRALFTKLFTALRDRRGSAEKAVRDVLADVDVAALDRAFRAYVAKLD